MRICRRMRARIERSMDRGLTADQELQLEEHLAGCPRCADYHDRLGALEEALSRLPEPPVDRLDVEGSALAIAARIEAEELASARRGRPRIARVAMAAAALAIAAGALYWKLASEGSPGPPVPERVAEQPPVVAPPLEPSPPTPPRDGLDLPAPDPVELATGPPLDPRRHEATRAAVGEHLLAALEGLPPEGGTADVRLFAERFDERVRELARDGWPVERLVRRFVACENPELSRAAVRYLGLRGDGISLAALERRLEEGLQETADPLAREVCLALLDAGEDGLDRLDAAARSSELRWLVLSRLTVDPERAAPWLEGRLRSLARSGGLEELEADLLACLVGLGPPAAEGILRLRREGHLEDGQALEALSRVEGAGAVLVAAIPARGRAEASFLLDAFARLRPPAALPWIGERCGGARLGGAALACLGFFDGPEAFEVAVELWASRILGNGELEDEVRGMIARNPEAALELAERWTEDRDQGRAGDLLGLLVSAEHPAGAPALVTLASHDLLSDGDRQLAAQSVGEHGTLEDARLLSLALRGMQRDERRLAAACVHSIHQLSGEDGVLEALSAAPERTVARVLGVLQERDGTNRTAVSLVQLARALEPTLASHGPQPWRIKP